MRRTIVVAAVLALAGSASVRADRVRVEVEGLDGDLRANALAALEIDDAGNVDEARIRRLHAEATDDIRRALQPFGYYRPEIEADLTRDERVWRAVYRVDPGPPLPIAALDLAVNGPGAEDDAFRRIVREFPLREGDRLVQPLYEAAKTQLLQTAGQRGYLDAELVRNEIRIDLDAYRAEVALEIETGPRYRFGPVIFEQDVLDENVIRGYVTFEPGDVFDLTRLLQLQATLSDSPYFSRVEVRADRERAEGLQVPVVVTLVPSRTQRWEVGAGYGSDTGVRGRLGLDLRRLNRQGHRGSFDARVSAEESLYSASYIVPGPYPRTDVVSYSVGYQDLDSGTAAARKLLVGVDRTESRGRWRESLGISYQEEDFTVGLDEGTSQLVVPEASWTRVIADDRLYTRHGRRLQLFVRGAAEEVLSDATFLQAKAEGKVVRTLFRDVRLIGRVEVGAIATDDFRELPATFRFFAGGDGSVRGYDFQQIGPEDAAGNVIGGEYVLTTTVEVDWLFFERWGRWGLAAFWDAGNVDRSFPTDLLPGAGLGIRWLSPVGMMRADVGWPLDDRYDGGLHVSISLGPDL